MNLNARKALLAASLAVSAAFIPSTAASARPATSGLNCANTTAPTGRVCFQTQGTGLYVTNYYYEITNHQSYGQWFYLVVRGPNGYTTSEEVVYIAAYSTSAWEFVINHDVPIAGYYCGEGVNPAYQGFLACDYVS